jgi:putative transposase
VRTIKSVTGKEIFRSLPSVKEILWGGDFWTDGYYIRTGGKEGNETVTQRYIQDQSKSAEYKQLYYEQLQMF